MGKVTCYCANCFVVFETESIFEDNAKLEPAIKDARTTDLIGKINRTIEAYEDIAALKKSEVEILRSMLLGGGRFLPNFRNFNWVLFFLARRAYKRAKSRAQYIRKYKDEYIRRKALQEIADVKDAQERRDKRYKDQEDKDNS